MPFVWAAIGAIVTAYFSEKWCKRVVRGSLLASYIPFVRDPALAQAYAQSIGMTGSPEMMAMFHRLLDEVRAEMAAGRISFKLRGDDDGPSGFTVDLLHPATAAAGALMLQGTTGPSRPVLLAPIGPSIQGTSTCHRASQSCERSTATGSGAEVARSQVAASLQPGASCERGHAQRCGPQLAEVPAMQGREPAAPADPRRRRGAP